MVSSNSLLWGSEKTRRRASHEGEVAPISVQIAGADPTMMAEAARYNADQGAQIIDINMGCPAKKICNVMAGSALSKDESLVGKNLEAVTTAVDIPVTLKIRTGWYTQHKNALSVAKLAEQTGIQALAIHGRTRACAYVGQGLEADIDETGKTYTARVTAINARVDAVAQTVELEASITGRPGELLAGMSGIARFAK